MGKCQLTGCTRTDEHMHGHSVYTATGQTEVVKPYLYNGHRLGCMSQEPDGGPCTCDQGRGDPKLEWKLDENTEEGDRCDFGGGEAYVCPCVDSPSKRRAQGKTEFRYMWEVSWGEGHASGQIPFTETDEHTRGLARAMAEKIVAAIKPGRN